jgi:hypothetical protein
LETLLRTLKISQMAKFRAFWDRCYDFKNIFAQNFSEKIGVFESKQS